MLNNVRMERNGREDEILWACVDHEVGNRVSFAVDTLVAVQNGIPQNGTTNIASADTKYIVLRMGRRYINSTVHTMI